MNKETLQGYNTRLNNNNSSLDTILEAINNLPEAGLGGGSSQLATYVADNVNFLDYRGNTLYSYTLDEIQELTELPPLPTGDMFPGLKWNWTLEELKESGIAADVGALYDIDDDIVFVMTVRITEQLVNKTSYVSFRKTLTTEEFSYTVDWGDGSELTTYTQSAGTSIGYYNANHIYNELGVYRITVRLQNATEQQLQLYTVTGSYMHNHLFSAFATGKTTSSNAVQSKPWWNNVEEIALGPKCKLSTHAFVGLGLRYVMICDAPIHFTYYCFYNCYNLIHLTYSQNTLKLSSDLGALLCYNCYALRTISLPYRFTENLFKNQMFVSCYNLRKIVVPVGTTGIGVQWAQSSFNLEYLWLPDEQVAIPSTMLGNLVKLRKVRLSPNISSLGVNCFSTYNGYITSFDFSKSTTIPTVETTSFNANTPGLRIIVPDELYDEWITTSNWATFSNYIIKASEA